MVGYSEFIVGQAAKSRNRKLEIHMDDYRVNQALDSYWDSSQSPLVSLSNSHLV